MKAQNPLNQAGLLTMSELMGLAKPKSKKDDRPENSIALRVIALLMAIILITAAATYVETPNVVTFLYIWGSVCGSYISYAFRNSKPAWLSIFPLIGTFIVCGIFTYELVGQFMFGKFEPLGPFIHVLTGLQALHFFDIRTRSDVSISIMIGLSVLCCVAAAGNGPLFGLYVAIYLFLGSVFLYLECVSRSKDVGPSRPLGEARPGSQSQAAPPRIQRQATGNVIFPVMSLPLLTVLVFFGLPRVDSIIDSSLASMMRSKIAVSGGATTGTRSGSGGGRGTTQGSGGGTGGSGSTGKSGDAGSGGSKDGRGTSSDASDVAAAQSGPGTVGRGGKPDGKGGKGGKGSKGGDDLSAGGGPGTGSGASTLTVSVDAEAANETMSLDRPPGKDELLLRVSSQRETCIRRIAFDTFDGRHWLRKQPRKLTAHIATAGQGVKVSDLPAFELATECPTVEVAMDVRVESEIRGVLPAVWVPSFVSSTIKNFFVDKDGTIIARQILRKGANYKIVSYVPVYDLTTLRGVTDKKPADEAYLQLPEGFSKQVSELAQKTAGEGNAFAKAERICNYLRQNYKYNATLESKVADGEDYVENFLFKTKQGNCKHFATSFVLMCRSVGVEARCVGGFLPGTLNKDSGFREIHMRDAHAWGETYLPNWGWIEFDATPDGRMPLHEQENILSSLVKHGLGSFGSSIQSKRKPIASSPQADPSKFDSKGDDKKKLDFWAKLDPRELLGNLPWKAFAVVLTVLSIAAIAWHYVSTRKKAEGFAETRDISRRSTQLYMEMLRDLQRYKIARNPADTPDEVLERLEASLAQPAVDSQPLPPELPKLVSSFMNVYCMDRFGNSDRTQELESICNSIHTLVTSK